MQIKCSKCGTKHEKRKHTRICKKCVNKKQRETRTITRNLSARKYEKTKKGFLVRAYRNMLSRVKGIQRPLGNHRGLEILDKTEFYDWALDNPDFHKLFEDWEEAEYNRKLTPSFDRIDPRFGYYVKNLQIVTHSENTVRGLIFRHRGEIV